MKQEKCQDMLSPLKKKVTDSFILVNNMYEVAQGHGFMVHVSYLQLIQLKHSHKNEL